VNAAIGLMGAAITVLFIFSYDDFAITILEFTDQPDRESYNELDWRLAELHEEIVSVKKEADFYRSAVSSRV
tara:strand:+ start:308 stop:523 length:216 start_codon:yes stop_codon:yes gene_type:complete